MIPAEQGQEQRWTLRQHGPLWDVKGPSLAEGLKGIEVVPASELEMCQRYFPFMRRSRDEAVKAIRGRNNKIDELTVALDEAEKREEALAGLYDRQVLRNRALVEAIEAHRASRHGDSPILRRADPWDEKLYDVLDQSGKP